MSFTQRSLPPRLTPRSLNKYKFLGEIETEFENILACSQMGSNNEKRRGQNLVTPSLKSIMSKHAKIEHFRKILLI